MKFLILNTDYSEFLRWLYTQNPGLEGRPYDEQHHIRMDSLFGTADFYSSNLRKLGHEAWDVIPNNEPMQKQWAREHGVQYQNARWQVRFRRGIVPWPYRKQGWLYSILAAQVKEYQPDVLYSMAIETIGSDFLRSVRSYYRLAVGQHAATALYGDIGTYDLVLSSLPNQVVSFRQLGLESELFRLGFEPRVLEKLKNGSKCYEIAFVGALGGIYRDGTDTLARLAERFPVAVWGRGIEKLAEFSPLRSSYRGSIWGPEMYQALRDSKIVFNRHSNLADRHFANNMRLYEATGVGTLLLTDYKENLADMFEPGREIVAYRNAEECAELTQHYLEHDSEREAIARAGQVRTLREHTYYHRMQELVGIVHKYL